MIKGYPVLNTLTIALMVLEHFSRGKGIGSKAYEALEEWAISRQLNRVRLGVLFGNEKGLKFWKSMGYSETGEIKPYLSKKLIMNVNPDLSSINRVQCLEKYSKFKAFHDIEIERLRTSTSRKVASMGI